MTNTEAVSFLKEYFEKLNAYEHMLSSLSFDTATVAPKGGIAYRNEQIGIVMRDVLAYQYDEKNLKTIEEISKLTLEEPYQRAFDTMYNELKKTKNVPQETLLEESNVMNEGNRVWEEAKTKQDYEMFKDTLRAVVKIKKEVISYDERALSPYEKTLDMYEEGMKESDYDAFFYEIKTRLVPFIKEVLQAPKKISDASLKQDIPIAKQIAFSQALKKYFLVDDNVCYLGESTHPFTMGLSPRDVRITTHYYENNLMSSIFSFIHEYGHAQYELQVSQKLYGLPTQHIKSLGMHESQSRLMENHIGRNLAFWDVMYPILQKEMDGAFDDIDKEEFLQMIHKSEASTIRIEADELTYPLHILIRYELEKELMNGEVDYDTFHTRWADKYEEYLGVRPNNDEEGILQDTHWSSGGIGYFPTYALGSAFAAQFFHQMQKDIDVDEALRTSDFGQIKTWLRENIHQYGSSLTSAQIMKKVTKEDFNPSYYIDYLIETYRSYYLD